MKQSFFLILLSFAFYFSSSAQAEVKISTATDKNQYFDTEYVYYSFIIENADIKEVTRPQFDGFQLVDTKIRSNAATSLIIINGKRVNKQEDKYEIIFVLKPLKRGSLVLPDAEIPFNGKVYRAPGKQIFVKKLNVPEEDFEKDNFVVVDCSNYNPYQGESFTLTYTIFSQYPLQDSEQFITRNPFINFGDFNFKELKRFAASTMVIKGKQYYTMQFQSHLLSAIKSGKKEIPSFPIEYATFRVINDGWFGRRERIDKKVFTPKVNINVRALPSSNNDFSGLVGDFSINVQMDKNSLAVNDALTVKYVLSGSGNFEILNNINPDFASSWEVFDPTVNEQTTISTLGKKGKKTFEFVIIPRKSGSYSVKPVTLTYFNPTIGQYQKISTNEMLVQIIGGDETTSNKTILSNKNSTKVEEIEEEIRYIKTNFEPQIYTNKYFSETKLFNYTWGLGFIFWVLLFFLPWLVKLFPDKKEQRKSKIQNIIKQFNVLLKNNNTNGNDILLLWEKYWWVGFNLDKSNQGLTQVTQILNEFKISDDLINRIKFIYNNLTMSQYAKKQVDNNDLVKQSIQLIKFIEEEYLLANDLVDNTSL